MIRRVFRPASLGVLLMVGLLWPVSGADVQGQAGAPNVVAIRNATILTVTRGTITNGTIVLRDGKIAAVGTNVQIPAGAEVVDGTGKFVAPGIIDAHSHMANDAINEGTTSNSAMVGMEDVLNPTDVNLYRALAGGTTSANIMHGSANTIGGKVVTIKLKWGASKASDLVFPGAMPGIKFALGENVKRPGAANTTPRRYPTTRQGVEYVMREAFLRAKAYKASWDAYDKQKASGAADLLPPRRDLQLDALKEVLEGKRLVHCHSYRADEILMVIRVADEMGFKVATFQHVLEGYKVAKEMAAHGAGGSTFSDWWGYKIEAEDAIPFNAAIMTAKGVSVSINSDSSEHVRRLNTEAAKASRWGDITDDQALSMVTINPARQLRIDNRVGSLEVGKDADVVIWTHNPLSTRAIVERTYIDGVLYYDRIKDLARAANVDVERNLLLGRQGAPPAAPAAEPAGTPVPAPQYDPVKATYNANGPAFAITNARIVTVTGSVIPKGTIVVRGNRIQAVGANVSVPGGARVIDAGGANVYPGFIDGGTDLGLNEPGVRGYEDVSEMLPFNQMLRTRVAFQSDSDAIPVARIEGITTAAIVPGGGVIGGEIPVMNLEGWTWEENTVRANAGLALVFPAGGGGGGRGGGAGGAGAAGGGGAQVNRLEELNTLLRRARAYMKNPNRAIDLTLEPFVAILDRKVPFFVSAATEPAIREAVAWANAQGVSLVIRTGPNNQGIAPFLKAHNVPVILTNVLTATQGADRFHAYTYQAPAAFAKAGVPFAFSSGIYEDVRQIPFQAGMAVAWGLDPDAAIRALTIDAAKILGIDAEVGSIEAGKIANLVIVRGDPLEIQSRIQKVFIAGREISLDSKQVDLFKRYMSRQ